MKKKLLAIMVISAVCFSLFAEVIPVNKLTLSKLYDIILETSGYYLSVETSSTPYGDEGLKCTNGVGNSFYVTIDNTTFPQSPCISMMAFENPIFVNTRYNNELMDDFLIGISDSINTDGNAYLMAYYDEDYGYYVLLNSYFYEDGLDVTDFFYELRDFGLFQLDLQLFCENGGHF